MNLGILHKCSRLRRGWTGQLSATGFAVVVGVFGLVGVHPAEGKAVAAPAAGTTAETVDGAFGELPLPPRWVPPAPPETTTTTTAPPETTTTTTAPPETTTTTTAPPETTTTTTAPPPLPPLPASGPLTPKAPAPRT